MSVVLSRRALAATLLLAAGPAFAQQGPVPVVASFTILADLVKEVGGERVAVSSLVGPNRDAHTFSPSPADARALAAAKLVVVNGLGFEHWAERLIKTANYTGARVVASDGVAARKLGNGPDPHAWQDPDNIVVYVQNIRDGLKKVDPAGAAGYDERAAAYIAKVKALDAELKGMIAAIPAEKRKVITSHDAFGYFGQAFGVTFIAPQGVNTESEATPKQVAAVINQIKREKIKAVFVENMSSPRLISQIARETGAEAGGTIYADALGGDITTYLAMMRHNGESIAKAMQ